MADIRVPLGRKGNIRHLPDVRRPGNRQSVPVITIRITCKEPPCGVVAAEGMDPTPFEGWLGMMRVVSEFVDRIDAVSELDLRDPGSRGLGRQLNARRDGELAEDVR
jgi:hypothetical protein